jgi:hypothetical protein
VCAILGRRKKFRTRSRRRRISKRHPKQDKYPRLEFVTADILTGIKPREFFLGKQYQRAATSGTMAPGGRGKSSLILVEAAPELYKKRG